MEPTHSLGLIRGLVGSPQVVLFREGQREIEA